MDNVVPLFGNKPKKASQAPVPQSIEGPILALIDWAEANGLDTENPKFQIRLADFVALLQTEIASKDRMSA